MDAVLRQLTPARLFGLVSVALVLWGSQAHTGRYISPEHGAGYLLGILGGSLMLLLLVYPARKRARWLGFVGGVQGWFRAHMVLGIVGPLCILFHSNFSLGATNSNVALFCMLVVSTSGVAGRYFYSRIHHGLYGRKATLAEFQRDADRAREVAGRAPWLAAITERIVAEEESILRRGRTSGIAGRLVLGWVAMRARRRLKHEAAVVIRDEAVRSPVVARESAMLARSVGQYIDRRIDASRRVAEFSLYERLFSLWHVLHLPLFLMLLLAGIVHVIAVHVY
jgi:hypothetical protein